MTRLHEASDIFDTRPLQENVAQSIGYCFAAGALLFSALGSVLTKKISNNFDKKVISSVIGFSILIIAFCTPFIDDALVPVMPMHTRDVETDLFSAWFPKDANF